MKTKMIIIFALLVGVGVAMAAPASATECDAFWTYNGAQHGGYIGNYRYYDGHNWTHCDKNGSFSDFMTINETWMHFDGFETDYWGRPNGVCRFVGTRVDVDTSYQQIYGEITFSWKQGDLNGGCTNTAYIHYISHVYMQPWYSHTNWDVDDPSWINPNESGPVCSNSSDVHDTATLVMRCQGRTYISSDRVAVTGFYDMRVLYDFWASEKSPKQSGGFRTWASWVGPIY